jgi:ribosomal protein S18 acetylase RimI-like enzyme
MNLRKAVPDDASAIARVHVDSWRSAYRDLVPDERLARLDYAHGAERFRGSIMAGSEYIYIAEKDADVIGFFALGRCRDSDADHETTGEIYALYLVSEYWRSGIGESMYQEAERILKTHTYIQAVAWVFAGNERARCFYEAMGFTIDGVTKTLNIGVPLNALRYNKIL